LGEIYILRSFLRPINRLPPELLAHIFGFLGAGSFVVPASHVCQRWRNIALSIPALWTVIREDDDVFAARCFMERSKNMMLDVSFVIDMRGEGFQEFQFVVAPYASRIERLHVEVYGDRVYDFYCLLAARDFEMPALEHFSIRMIEYGFQDDSRDGPLQEGPFFRASEPLKRLTFRAALPLQTQFSPAIRSLTLAERVFDLDALLGCLGAAPNLEYLACLNSVPHTFECTSRSQVSLNRLRELHWFQLWVFDNILGTVKLFEHLDTPNLDTTQFVLLLDPTRYAYSDLYPPCHRSVSLFRTVTELHLEASHFTPGKPARNNIIFHGRHDHETLFSVRVQRATLPAFCALDDGIFLASSLHVDPAHITHLTLTSVFPYSWARFFRTAWTRFFRTLPAIKVLRLCTSKPLDIIAALAAADELAAPAPAALVLPDLRALHLFARNKYARAARATAGTAPTEAAVAGNMWDGDAGETLIRFLQRRADLGARIETLICSAESAAALPPAVLALVDAVEPAAPGAWAEPAFPRRMVPLLEEHLN
jgi:hypothetical protein